jgi:hypothetical protein
MVARLPDGVRGMWRGDTVVLDDRLGRRQRNATLAHELVHEERRVGWPDATPATMEREEAIVRRITAERLVPVEELAELAARAELNPVEVWEVAEHFDVPVDVLDDHPDLRCPKWDT